MAFALASPEALAQSLGVASILNPEGSRLFPQSLIFPRHPGKPDPRWKSFNWRFIDLKSGAAKYRLYFYDEEAWTAQYVMPRIHDQIIYMINVFNYVPSTTFSYLLFSSQREFQQANIFNISEGVQGITSTTEATMAIPYWGQDETFRHISTHEMVHQFQVQKVTSISNQAGSRDALFFVPLWFIEGMAEYYSLHGVDRETRYFIRDLLAYPDKSQGHVLPGLFEEGALNFTHVYKVGQIKIDFFEKEFGKGTVQRLLEAAATKLGTEFSYFAELVSHELAQSIEEMDSRWKEYVSRTYMPEVKRLSQSLLDFPVVEQAGENLDLYDLSPNGELIAIRELDPISGVTSIRLIDLKDKDRRIEVDRDRRPGLLSLFFFQKPTLALSNNRIAYMVSTIDGPELAIQNFSRDAAGKIRLDESARIELHRYNLIDASSPAFSPDARQMVFVGVSLQGTENLYLISFTVRSREGEFRQLTREFYSWKTLSWSPFGIYGSSDRTANRKYGIFRIHPEAGTVEQIAASESDLLSPERVSPDRLVYQSWSSGSSQAHTFRDNQEIQWTEAKTALLFPKFRQNQLYALGFKSGRYHLYRIPPDHRLAKPVSFLVTSPEALTRPPWEARLAPLPPGDVQQYRPFLSSGVRLDNLIGFLGSGNIAGFGASFSDLMRNYSVTGEFSILGDVSFTTISLFLSSQKGRSTWTLGGYHVVQSRLDNVFMPDDFVTRTYLHREFGVLGMLQYPLGAYLFYDLGLRLGGVKRSDFSDPSLEPAWEAVNPGIEPMIAPVVRLGYDRILYELYAGPLKGLGLLFEADTSYFPSRAAFSERLRFDAAYYVQAVKNTVLAFQGVAGANFGELFGNPFLVSSDDIMRAYPFGDPRLRGNYVLIGKTEFRFPIGSLFKFSPLRGLVAYDYGSIFRTTENIRAGVASSISGGLSLNFPPITLSLILSHPLQTAPGPVDSPVGHFLLRYLYL